MHRIISRNGLLMKESIANNTPDRKWAAQYNAEQNAYLDEYYNNAESIANNTPDVRKVYLADQGQGLAYDKDGNLLPNPWDDVVIRDDQGRVIRSGESMCVELR